MHRLIAALMSLFWLLNAVAASAFMSGVEQEDGGFLIPICSGGQIILVDLSEGELPEDGEGQPSDVTMACPLLSAAAPLPQLFGEPSDLERIAVRDVLPEQSAEIPGDQSADRPGARGPPALS